MALNFTVASNRGRGWKPGQSGNPNGRAADLSLQELCKTYTEEAVKTLVVAMRNPKERVIAAKEILDRGWGRPKQVISTDGEQFNITHLHMLAAQIVSEEIMARQAQPQTITPDETTKIATQQRLLDAPKPAE